MAVEFHEADDQVTRRQEFLAEYDMEIVHRKGASHNNADSLSMRHFDEDSHMGNKETPGDGNAFCSHFNSSGNFIWHQLQMEDKYLKLVYY